MPPTESTSPPGWAKPLTLGYSLAWMLAWTSWLWVPWDRLWLVALQGTIFCGGLPLLIGWITTFAKSYNIEMESVLNAIGIATPENLDDNMFRDFWSLTSPQIADILPYILMVLILIFRPEGLFGKRTH